jgi:hypothetical protein
MCKRHGLSAHPAKHQEDSRPPGDGTKRPRNRNRTPGPGGRGRTAVARRCRGGGRLSARGPRHLSARDPRRLSARGPRHLSAWSERTAHRACARSGGLLQRTQ